MSQSFALARAAAPRPALLLADEPTGNLGGANGRAIMDQLFSRRDRHGAAPALAARCDRVIRLADGQLAPEAQAAE